MIGLLKKIYHKYSNVKLMKLLSDVYRNGSFAGNYMAYRRMKKLYDSRKNGKKDRNGVVRVAFICQYAQIWNKLQSVYEKMKSDSRFEVYILAVPEDIKNVNDNIYNYFRKLYGSDVINARTGEGRWYDLRRKAPDYVFVQRPYDQYLPPEYRGRELSKYTRVCFVDYGYLLTKTAKTICLSKRFLRNVYYFFAENNILKDFNRKRFKLSHKNKYRKTVNIGFPVLEDFMNKKPDKPKRDDRYTVLWTPRWTEDKNLGGSNFMRFKDKAVKLVELDERLYMIFRPHPMTFSHMIEINKMTEEEVKEYIGIYESSDRLEYDTGREYAETFWNSDAIITDISSIVIEYFITGKPIIYCKTGAVPDEAFKEILKSLYVVGSWEEAEAVLVKLLSGDDPKRQLRQQKMREQLGDNFEHISDRFLDEIYNDYNS